VDALVLGAGFAEDGCGPSTLPIGELVAVGLDVGLVVSGFRDQQVEQQRCAAMQSRERLGDLEVVSNRGGH
jgi:hypothetical protein